MNAGPSAPSRPRLLVLVGALALLLAAPVVSGQAVKASRPAAESGPVWASLTVAQQQALDPLKPEWSGIDATRKQKWLDVAARLHTMSPAERDRVQQRMAEWARMTPTERGRARQQFQEVRRIPSDDRQQRWNAYQSLPNDQRQALTSQATQAVRKPVVPTPAASASRPAAENPTTLAKRNVVTIPNTAPAPKAVAPTVVQARPGATTSLVTQRPMPPTHHQAGLPKVNALAGFVDPETLLPRRGPQGAAAQSAAPPAGASRAP